jgi:hypothetical protein
MKHSFMRVFELAFKNKKKLLINYKSMGFWILFIEN